MDLVRWLVHNMNLLAMYPHDDCGLAIWLLPLPKTQVDRSSQFQYKLGNCTETLIVQHGLTSIMQQLYEQHQAHPQQFCSSHLFFPP